MHGAVDDSDVVIDSRPHTILGGLLTTNAGAVEDALEKLKQQFGLSVQDEIKWNGMKLEKRDREALSQELLILLRQSATLVTISEGNDQQQAAEHWAIQLADYFDTHTWQNANRVEIAFDEGIVRDPCDYATFLKETGRSVLSRVEFKSVRSHESGLVQLADILAGFNRLTTEIALGRHNQQIRIWDDGLGDSVDIDLLNYICLSLRWTVWGEVPPPPDPKNPKFDTTWPFKHVGGFGLRVFSSVPANRIQAIYDAQTVYMGCLH